jgi:hypothetical protein
MIGLPSETLARCERGSDKLKSVDEMISIITIIKRILEQLRH